MLAALLLASVPSALPQSTASDPDLLQAGYRALYNLQFDQAHAIFRRWQGLHPDDPMGPVSDAAAYLFSEFDRMHVLESELFTNDARYENRSRATPDPAAKQGFERQVALAQQLAGNALARDPNNGNAMFASVLALGLRGDYASLIERRDLASLGYIKTARGQAEKLLTLHPDYYDAYLAVGVENYLLSLKPAPVRWILSLTGAQTDKQTGLAKLRITAEKGHYLAPFARLLLAVAALRDGKPAQARGLLQYLAGEFPQNRLYARELSKLQ